MVFVTKYYTIEVLAEPFYLQGVTHQFVWTYF